jgi:phospholipase C
MDVTAMPRRRLLAAATAVAALALIWAGPGPVATARPKAPIRHVVVLYLENHTFDNLLGYWCDQNLGRCPDGGMPARVVLSDGSVVTPRTAPDLVPFMGHSIGNQLAAIDGGRMDGWQKVVGCQASTNYECIIGYQPSQMPNLSALASRFAISDRFFSLADSPSWGGHLDIVASNLDGFPGTNPLPATGVKPGVGWGCDSDKVTPDAAGQPVPACMPDPRLIFHGAPLPNGGAFEPTPMRYEPTIMDELNAAGLPWKIYGGTCPQETTATDGLQTCTATKGYDGYEWAICPSIAECLYTQKADTAATPQFFTDAAAGHLPAFSIVTPGSSYFTDSCHNSYSITACDNFVGQVASAVMQSPDWSSTVLFITWDDCGCFYDNVAPPRNADGTQEGPRVPLVIVSPYARPGYTDTTAASFDGILAYTEHTFGLAPLGVNDAHAYPLTNAFNGGQAPLPPVRMVTRPLPPAARHIHLTPALLNDPT